VRRTRYTLAELRWAAVAALLRKALVMKIWKELA
jgi:hypothetical protein